MNRVLLMGNLARAVELRELGAGRVVGKTILAVSRMRRGQRIGTDWVPITLWDRQAQAAARYLDKGSRVAVEGRLHVDYVAVKGAESDVRRSRLAVEVIVDRITYLSSVRRSSDAPEDAAEERPAGGRTGR